ncbi:hypothetical protein FQR65_LT06959 [Abscondita terminalis]|nr:hypothetical protein FQR65_LT06959 [Abscondita terminalis]
MYISSFAGLYLLLSVVECILVKREAPLPSGFSFSSVNSGLDLPNFYDNSKGSSVPSSGYGAPNRPSSSYGVPQKPSIQYGPPPAEIHNSYLPPSKPSVQYGAPAKPAQSYGVPSVSSHISQSYGAPTKPLTSYGPPPSGHFGFSSSSNQYIPPAVHSSPQLSPSYGIPSIPSTNYGTPSVSINKPSSNFGFPSLGSGSGSYYSAGASHSFGSSITQKYDSKGDYVY